MVRPWLPGNVGHEPFRIEKPNVKSFLRPLAIAGLVIVILLMVALAVPATPPGRMLVANLIERSAAGAGVDVSIDRPTGWAPFSFGAGRIVLADGDGVFAETENLDVRINVPALLTGAIVLNAVSADKVRVKRLPVLPAAEPGGGSAPPVAVAQLNLRRLELGAALARREAVLAVAGSAALERGGGLSARIEAERIDGRDGRFAAVVMRSDDTSGFSGELSLREADNGILIGLLGRTAGPAYQLEATLTPEAGGQRGRISLGSAGTARLDGEFALATGTDSRRLTVRANGNLGEFVPADFGDLLGGRIDVDVDGSWSATPLALAIRQGTITTDTIDATVAGTLSETSADMSLEARIVSPDGNAIRLPATDARMNNASVSGTVAPVDGVIRLDLAGHVAGLAVGDVTVPGLGWSMAAESEGGLPGPSVPFAIRGEADEIIGPGGSVVASDTAPLLLTVDGTWDRATATAPATATVRAAGGIARFTGTLGETVTGALGAEWTEIAPIAGLAGQSIGGGVYMSAEGQFAGEGGTDLAVAATLEDIALTSAELTRFLAGESRLAGRLQAGSGGSVALGDLTFGNDRASASGQAALEGDTVRASLSGEIADLGAIVDDSSGAARFDADVEGSLAAPRISATIEVPDAVIAGRTIRDARIVVAGGPDNGGWRGPVSFRGEVAGAGISGEADVAVDDGAVTLPRLEVALADNTIAGDVRQVEGGLYSGRFDVDAPRLDQLAALAATEADGALTGELVLTPDGGTQTASFAFAGSDIIAGGTTVRAVDGAITVTDVLTAPKVAGQATARNLAVGDLVLSAVDATAEVTGNVTSFRVSADGRDIDLGGTGSFTADPTAPVLRIDTLSGSAFGGPIALGSPAVIRFDETAGDIANVSLGYGGGTVVIDVHALDSLDIDVRANGVAASAANGFVPGLGAAGSVSATAAITGTPQAPRIAWEVTWSDAQLEATRQAGLPPFALSARGAATTDRTTVTGRVSRTGLDLAFAGDVPFTGPGLSLDVSGPAPLALLAARSAREVRLGGSADVAVSVTGSLLSPQITGAVDLGGVTAIDGVTGFGVTGATGRIVFDGQSATLDNVQGRLAQGGDVTVAGGIRIADPALPASLTVVVSNGRYTDERAINAAFDANLAINGPLLGAAEISGRVDLGRTELQLADLPTGDATALETRHVNTASDFSSPVRPDTAGGGGSESGGGMRLSIDLTARQGIIARGFGVDAEFGGTLAVRGTTNAPRAIGSFDLVWGRLEVLGRRFTLDTGTLTFSGDVVPTVALSASTTTADAVVTVSVTGRADDPTISFSSNPDLPEEEILSRLLFERSAGSLSALQAIQLVDALAQLTGVNDGGGIFTRVRNALGVDDLDIRESESGGTTVGVGTRVSDRVRIGVEAGADTDGGRVTIDLDLTDNLKARAEADGDGGSKVGITFEREY